MSVSPLSSDKPGMFVALSITTLVSGILNILLGLGWTVSIVVGTIGIGLICTPITILPVVLGIFEILYAVKLLANPPQPVQPSQTIAILEICCIVLGGVIEAGVGIFALVAYSDTSVKQYFEKINS